MPRDSGGSQTIERPAQCTRPLSMGDLTGLPGVLDFAAAPGVDTLPNRLRSSSWRFRKSDSSKARANTAALRIIGTNDQTMVRSSPIESTISPFLSVARHLLTM